MGVLLILVPPNHSGAKGKYHLLSSYLVQGAAPASSHWSVQFSHSVVSNSLQPHELQHTRLPITNYQSLLKLMSIKSVMPSNHLILCCPLLLPPSIFPSIRVFSNESALRIRWPKYWSFSFSISPSNEYSGLISFRIDWSDLLAVQETLKNLLQNHNLKASVLWHSAFFMVQLSHLHTTTGKTMTLTIKTFSKLLYPYPAYFPIWVWVMSMMLIPPT